MRVIYPSCPACNRLLKEVVRPPNTCEFTRLRTCEGCGSRVQIEVDRTSVLCTVADPDTDRAAELHAEGQP